MSAAAASRAAKLRLAFDQAFAEPVRLDTAVKELLLAVRVGTQSLAIRLSEINGLFADKMVTPVPGGHAALRGIAGFRGAIVPVYDLKTVLGEASDAPPRWLVTAAAAPVALAFDAFERQLEIPREAILPRASVADIRGFAREFVGAKEFVGPIIHLPTILEAIDGSRSGAMPVEEH